MTNKTSDYDLTVIVPVYNERGNMLRLETPLIFKAEMLVFSTDCNNSARFFCMFS